MMEERTATCNALGGAMLYISSYLSMLGNAGRQHFILFICDSEECTVTS